MSKSSSVLKKVVNKVTPKKPVAKKPIPKSTVAKKTVVKKTVPKKTRPASQTAKPLVYADNQQSFWVSNGEILNSLLALRDALSVMDEMVYAHHVRPEQNDFAIWVNDVLCDNECAQGLVKAKTPKSAHAVVVRHLKLYSV